MSPSAFAHLEENRLNRLIFQLVFSLNSYFKDEFPDPQNAYEGPEDRKRPVEGPENFVEI